MILNSVTTDGKVLGYVITDGDLQYAICKDGLLSPAVFDTLIKEGYRYFGNGVFEDEKGVNIEDYPAIDYMKLSAEAKADFDVYEKAYTDSDVVSHISKRPPATAPKFEVPTDIKIHTREELLKFLSTKLDPMDPLRWRPLNSFVDPSALFTLQEYYKLENSNAIQCIQEREAYSLEHLL